MSRELEKAKAIVFAAIDEINQLRPRNQLVEKAESTPLFGEKGVLDSLGLVNLIVAVEEVAEDEHDISLTLGQESTVAAQRKTFETIETLIEQVAKLLDE